MWPVGSRRPPACAHAQLPHQCPGGLSEHAPRSLERTSGPFQTVCPTRTGCVCPSALYPSSALRQGRLSATVRDDGFAQQSHGTWHTSYHPPSWSHHLQSMKGHGTPTADSAAATRLGQSGSRAPRQEPNLWQTLPRTPFHTLSLPREGSTTWRVLPCPPTRPPPS